jgi:Short C-terminal domain
MRRGPGLVGTVARTAVIAGTATAVSGSMVNHQQSKQQEAAEEAAAQQQAYQNQADLQTMQEQMAAMQAQQVQAAMPPAPAPAPAPATAPQTDIVAQLKQLGDLKTAGVLSDEEFQTAKAKLLAG